MERKGTAKNILFLNEAEMSVYIQIGRDHKEDGGKRQIQFLEVIGFTKESIATAEGVATK